jgi:hypothetical protein
LPFAAPLPVLFYADTVHFICAFSTIPPCRKRYQSAKMTVNFSLILPSKTDIILSKCAANGKHHPFFNELIVFAPLFEYRLVSPIGETSFYPDKSTACQRTPVLVMRELAF